MAGFNFFTSLASIFNAEWISSEKVTVKGRNSAVEETSLRGIREGGIEASRKQASKQLITRGDAADHARKKMTEKKQEREDAAHEKIGAQTKKGRNVVNYGVSEQSLESKLKKVDKGMGDLREGEKVAERKRRRDDCEDQAPLRDHVPVKKQKTKAPVLERVGPPKQETEGEKEMKRWRELAKRYLKNKDVTSFTINGETLTREEAAYRGWVGESGGKGGGRNGGGGRGMGG